MYRLYCDGHPLWIPGRGEDMGITDGKLTAQLDKPAKLEFTLPAGNRYYSAVHGLTSTVWLYDDDEVLFVGRPISTRRDFWNNRRIVCEDPLAWLKFAVAAPFETATHEALWSHLTSVYNAQAAASRQLTLGSSMRGPYSAVLEDYATVWDALTDIGLPSVGEGRRSIQPTYTPGATRTVQPAASVWMQTVFVNGQPIRFGQNLLDLDEFIDWGSVVTALYPLGRDVETGETDPETGDPIKTPLTIAAVHGGDPILRSAAGTAAYGPLVEMAKYSIGPDDETTETEAAQLLMDAAAADLAARISAALTLELTAVDLSLAGVDVRRLRLGQLNDVISPPHGYNATHQCTKISMDLGNPERNKYTFGVTKKALTEMI